MKIRIIFCGKTNKLDDMVATAKEVNATAKGTHLGLVCPDDAIEADVKDIDEGKSLMKHIYKAHKNEIREYAYTDEDWFDNEFNFVGVPVYNANFDWERKPKHIEDFSKFLA